MDMLPFFKSIIDQDNEAIVICDLNHDIIYMNPAASEEYADDSGYGLIGRSIFDCHSRKSAEMIYRVVRWFEKDAGNNVIHTFFSESRNMDFYMVALRDGGKLIGYYEKHVSRTPDTVPAYKPLDSA